MPDAFAHVTPARLAEILALTSGAVAAASDDELCDILLHRLCDLVGASTGLLVRREGPSDVVQAACRCVALAPGHDLAAVRPGDATLAGLDGAPVDVLSVPLAVREAVVGRLELARRDGEPFTAEGRSIAEAVAPRLALLVERRRLLDAEVAAQRVAAAAVDALRAKEERLEAMCDGTFDFIGLTTPDGRLIEVNRTALDLVGVARADVIDRPFWETPWWAHDPGQQARLRAAMARAAGGDADEFDATHVSRTGAVVAVDFMARPVAGRDGRVAFIVVEGRDVTREQEAARAQSTDRASLVAHVHSQAGRLADVEATLRQAEAMYQAVAETIVDGLIVIDAAGRIQWANTAATSIFGYAAAEMVGHNVRMLMPDRYAREHDGYMRHYLDTGVRKIIGIGREVEGRRKDGSTFPMYLGVGETIVNGERRFTGVVRNLSTTKHLEQQLQERQTLARIGELAAVVAHEVRNPLAAIRGVVEVIQTRFPEASSDRKVLGDLLARVDSLDRLVSDLLVYARPTPPIFDRTQVLELARSTAALAQRDRTVAAVRFEVTGDDVEMQADAAQLSRALLNLLTNAAQAMRHDGAVRIRGTRLGGRYQLTVEDEGPGMAPDVIQKCLEPFFTTKTRGTGLGLPIARRVVEEHGGTMTLSSEVGRGTCIVIELPLDAPMA